MADSKRKKTEDEPKLDLTFEQGIEKLESIIERIEAGEVGLEESLAEYERGMALIRHCSGILDRCDLRVEEITKEVMRDDEEGASAAGNEETSR